MRSGLLVLLALAATALTAGCGQPLGSYTVEGVSTVPTMTLTMNGREPGYGEYFQIDLASETDLTGLGPGVNAIYAHADFCPMRDDQGLVVFGPGDENNREVRSSDPAIKATPGADGLFRYRLFIVAAHPMPDVRYSASWADHQRYDLRTTQRDVCVRLHAPGYNLTPSQSRVIRIQARRFVEAARNTPRQTQAAGGEDGL